MIAGLSEGAPCQSLFGNMMSHHVPKQPGDGKGRGSHPLQHCRVLSSLCIFPLGCIIYAILWLLLPSIKWRFPNQYSYHSVYIQLPPSVLTCHVQSYVYTPPITCPFNLPKLFPISVPGHPCSYLLAEIWVSFFPLPSLSPPIFWLIIRSS